MTDFAEMLSVASTAVAALTGIVATVLALIKFIDSKKFEFEANRPFIIPNILVEIVDGDKCVFLQIKNVGNTPARNVKLIFLSQGRWNWVTNPDYPFSNEDGISAIGPNEFVTYFLGVIRKGNPLEDLESRNLFGVVEFDHPVKDMQIKDEFRTSLTESRYKAK